MSIERVDPPLSADEETTVRAFLDYHRATLRRKIAGLDRDQLAATLAPSTMTLGGLAKHLAYVEHWWFQEVFAGRDEAEPWASVDWDADADWDWHSAVDDEPEEVRALLDHEIAASDAVIDAATSLDQLSARTGREGEPFSLRWVLVHMVEEYCRHNGHADLLRESVDGTVGE